MKARIGLRLGLAFILFARAIFSLCPERLSAAELSFR